MKFVELVYKDKTVLLNLERVVSITVKEPHLIDKDRYQSIIEIIYSTSNDGFELTFTSSDEQELTNKTNEIYSRIHNIIRKEQKSIERLFKEENV